MFSVKKFEMLRTITVICLLVLLGLVEVESCSIANLEADLADLMQVTFAANSGLQESPAVVTVTAHQIVCLTTGSTRGTYTRASVVAEFNCAGNSCPTTGSPQQLEFQCDPMGTMTWSNVGGLNFGVPDGATLMTPLRTDCGICLTVGGVFASRWDSVTHCIACSPLCNTGLMECTGLTDSDCCNGVVNNMCVDNCTAPARPLTSANYTCTQFCDPLITLANSAISLSDDILVGSVATYSCETNYELIGSSSRTCQVSGTTTAWSGAAPSCSRMTVPVTSQPPTAMETSQPPPTTMETSQPTAAPVMETTALSVTCDALTQGANQIITYTGSCMVEISCKATYSCGDKYELKDGDNERTCKANGGGASWSGTTPKCDMIQDPSSELSGGAIAGIVIAILVVLAIIIIVIVVVPILAYRQKKR